MSETEKQYTLSEAARMLGVTTKTLRNWDRDGKLSTTRTAGGHRRVSESEINRLLFIETRQGSSIMNNEQDDLHRQVEDLYTNPSGIYSSALVPMDAGNEDAGPPAGNNPSLLTPAVAQLSSSKNPDEVIDFTRDLVHRIEDQLNARLTDDEYRSFEEIVFATHERGLPRVISKPRLGYATDPLVSPRAERGGYQ